MNTKVCGLVFLLLVCFLPAKQTRADQSLTIGIWTEHYAGDHTEGLDNHLLALDLDGPTFAFFKNSYGKETGYVGWTWHTKKVFFDEEENWWIRGNVSVGVLAGYGHKHPVHFGMFSPGMYPTVNIGRKKWSVGVGVMPTFWWTSIKVEF